MITVRGLGQTDPLGLQTQMRVVDPSRLSQAALPGGQAGVTTALIAEAGALLSTEAIAAAEPNVQTCRALFEEHADFGLIGPPVQEAFTMCTGDPDAFLRQLREAGVVSEPFWEKPWVWIAAAGVGVGALVLLWK